MDALERGKYPIGRFTLPSAPLNASERAACIDAIEAVPSTFRTLVGGLSDEMLDTPYRASGWTIRQVVHHVPDSHMNMYIRMKLAVTEDTPTIKPYDEQRWALLPDGRSAPIAMSLDLLDALHRRWVAFLRTLSDADFEKAFVHPDLGTVAIDQALAMYAWHGQHHAAHIRQARAATVREGD